MPDLKGLFVLAMIGLGCAVVAAILAPVALFFGMAWLSEPRLGESVWTITAWASGIWILASSAFFGTAFFGRW